VTPAPAPAAPASKKETPKVQNQADVDEAIKQANEAIKAGKDPVLVKKRLQEMGIELKGE
jgi:hypothetical protein